MHVDGQMPRTGRMPVVELIGWFSRWCATNTILWNVESICDVLCPIRVKYLYWVRYVVGMQEE